MGKETLFKTTRGEKSNKFYPKEKVIVHLKCIACGREYLYKLNQFYFSGGEVCEYCHNSENFLEITGVSLSN